MGGLREDTIEAPTPPNKSDTISTTIRFHEDPKTGQVHFHDDANGLKVGIPVAAWYVAWQRIKQANNEPTPYTWTYTDAEHLTQLTVKSGLNMFATPPTFEVALTIVPVQLGNTFQKLDAFMPERKRG